MADRSVLVRLGAQVAGYVGPIEQAARKTEDFAQRASRSTSTVAAASQRHLRTAGAALGEVSGEATAAGLALMALPTAAVVASTAFDKQMSAVQAAASLTGKELDRMREAALQAGADTAFSAREAAQGQEELAKAGVSTADILGGGLTGALSLAAAGGIGVAEAAETAATALTIFGLQGSDVEHVADLLAAGAGKAQGSVTDMGMALKQSGLVAAQTGLSIEETTAGLAAFASAGLLGSDAGTSFKTMLQRLTPQSDEAAALMEDLGINAFDAQGQFIGLAEYAGQLQTALSTLTPEQRQAALTTLFGADAIRAATVLYEQGADGVRQWQANVDDAGFAAEQAAARTDNLAGDLERLAGSLETLAIKGGSEASGGLRFLAQSADAVVNTVGGMNGVVVAAGLAVAGVAGAGLIAVPRLADMSEGMERLEAKSKRTATAVRGAGKAVAGLAGLVVVSTVLNEVAESSVNAGVGASALNKKLMQLGEGTTTVAGLGIEVNRLSNIWSGAMFRMDDFDIGETIGFLTDPGAFESIRGWGLSMLGLQSNVSLAQKSVSQLDQQLADMVTAGRADQAAAAYDRLLQAVADDGGDVEKAKSEFRTYNDTLIGVADGSIKVADSSEDMGERIGGLVSPTQEAADATKALDGALKSLKAVLAENDAELNYYDAIGQLSEQMEGYRDAIAEANEVLADPKASKAEKDRAQAALDQALADEKAAKSLDIKSEAGREAIRTAEDIVNSQGEILAQDVAVAKSSDEVAAATTRRKEELRKELTALGLNRDAVDRYVAMLDEVPSSVSTDVTLGAGAAQQELDTMLTKLQSIANRSWVAKVQVTKTGEIVIGGPGGRRVLAEGGLVTGPGGPRDDRIPAMLSNGEFVQQAASVAYYGPGFMRAVNERRFPPGLAALGTSTLGTAPGYARGGLVLRLAGGGPARETPAQRAARERRDAARQRVTDAFAARARDRDSIAGGLVSASSVLDFDADGYARALQRLAEAKRGVADADRDVLDARRAVNRAGTPEEQAQAARRLADAERNAAGARRERAAAERDVATSRPTAANIKRDFAATLVKLRRFHRDLRVLARRGLHPSILRQLANAGPDGAGAEASALASGSDKDLSDINRIQGGIETAARGVGIIGAAASNNAAIAKAQNDARRAGVTTGIGPAVTAPTIYVQPAPVQVTSTLVADGRVLLRVINDERRRQGRPAL